MPLNEKRSNLLMLVVSVICALVIGEVGLRVLSSQDIDGNVYLGELHLRPFRIPVKNVETRVAQYLEHEEGYTQYDPDTGWSVRPNGRSADGMYIANSFGIRTADSRKEPLPTPASGTLRIAIFGDSFTHGDDVPYVETWGAILEDRLNRANLRAEVLNLGGGGYAMDQAFLRWRKNGKPLKPHIVLFGFQNSNIKRNMNLFRIFYSPFTGIIFSKPRFILEGEKLTLVNAPTVKPEDLVSTLENFSQWEFRSHEFYFQEENYTDSIFYNSRLAAFAVSGITMRFSSRRKGYDFFATDSNARKLAWGIIERFEQEVTQEGARFVVVHIPTKRPIQRLKNGDQLRYQELLNELVATYEVVDPAADLIRQADADSYKSLFLDTSSHYSALGNRVVGEAVAKALLAK